MSGLENLDVDLSVVLGKTVMSLQRFLKLGRGAVVELETGDGELVDIRANGHLVARGEVAVSAGRIAVEITELVGRPIIVRDAGARIGDQIEIGNEF